MVNVRSLESSYKIESIQLQVQLIYQFLRALSKGQGQTNYSLRALYCGGFVNGETQGRWVLPTLCSEGWSVWLWIAGRRWSRTNDMEIGLRHSMISVPQEDRSLPPWKPKGPTLHHSQEPRLACHPVPEKLPELCKLGLWREDTVINVYAVPFFGLRRHALMKPPTPTEWSSTSLNIAPVLLLISCLIPSSQCGQQYCFTNCCKKICAMILPSCLATVMSLCLHGIEYPGCQSRTYCKRLASEN